MVDSGGASYEAPAAGPGQAGDTMSPVSSDSTSDAGMNSKAIPNERYSRHFWPVTVIRVVLSRK